MTPKAKRRLAILIAAVGAVGVSGTSLYVVREQMREREARRGLEEGRAALERGEYQAALAGLGAYVARHRDDPEALLLLARARREVPVENGRHLTQAISLARLAAEHTPDTAEPLELLLDLYPRLGFVNETLATADALLAIKPGHPDALRARVAGLAALGRTDDALEAARAVARVTPDDIAAHRVVLALMQRAGKPSQELATYVGAVVERLPDSPLAAVLQAQVAALAGDADAALDAARRAASLPIQTAQEVAEVLQLLEQLRLAREADALLERLAADPALDREVALVTAQRAWKSGDLAAAREALRAATTDLAQASDDELGWCVLTHHGLPDGPAAAAAAELASRTSSGARDWTALLQAVDDIAAGRFAQAAAALAFPPEGLEPLARYFRGRALLGLGDWRSTTDLWQQLVDNDPSWRSARLWLVNILAEHGLAEKAFTEAEAAFAFRRGLAEAIALGEAGLALLEAGRTAAVDPLTIGTLTEDIVRQVPDEPAGHVLRIRFLLVTGDVAGAAAATDQLLAAGAAPSAKHLVALAEAWARSDLDRAVELARRAHEAAPDDPDIGFATALTLARRDPARAEQILQDGLDAAADPVARLAWGLRLALLLDRHDPDRARPLLAQLAAESPDNARVQLAVLESESAWGDGATIAAATERLRGILGESSALWRLNEARRLLTFSPTEANAAKAIDLLRSVVGGEAHTGALSLYADAWLKLGDRAQAIESLSRAADAAPAQAGLYPELVSLLQEAGRSADAESRLLAFLQIKDIPPQLRRMRAALLAAQGMRDEAAADLQVLADAGDPRDVLALAVFEAQRGNASRARALFDQLLASATFDAKAIVMAADFYASQGEFERGLALFDRLPADLPPDERNGAIAAYLSRHGSPDRAEELLAEGAKSGRPQAVALLAQFYLTHGRAREAAAVLAPALKAHPDSAGLARLDALARLASAGAADARDLERLLPLLTDSESPEPVRELVDALRQLSERPDDRDAFVASLQRLTQRHPRFYPGWAQLVSALRTDGKSDEAVDAARAAARLNPADPRPARLATELLLEEGRLDEARLAAMAWRERTLLDPLEADVAIASIDVSLGNADAAVNRLLPHRSRITGHLDANRDAAYALAHALAAAGRAAEAHEMLWAKAESDLQWAQVYLQVARSPQVAAPVRREWIRRIEPVLAVSDAGALQLAQAWFDLGAASVDEEALTTALRWAEPLRDHPQLRGAAAGLAAICHDQLGHLDEAIRYYELAIEALPDHHGLLNNLAYARLRQDPSSEEALRLVDRAIAAAKAEHAIDALPGYLDTRGTALLGLNQLTDAERTFREGLALAPTNQVLLLGLADVLVRKGDTQQVPALLESVAAGPPLSEPLQRRYDSLLAATRTSSK